jgi:thiamine pyrophosphokinase
MSSHHIVREDQEPALLILNAHAISFEKIQELLEWMPTVIVTESEIETVVAWGIKVDVVLVHEDKISSWQEKLIEQTPVKIISFDGEDNIDSAFQYLKSGKATAVNCLLKTKVDLTKFGGFSFDVDCFMDNTRWSWIKSGRIEKWMPKGARLQILPIEIKNEFAELIASDWLINKDGIVKLESPNPFWFGEELGISID